jgi:tetratricopeptide (TPR) repeat protein
MAGVQQDLSFEGSQDPDEWRRWAREWREAGRFEEALRAHEWYHAHVLELDEAAYGVRLSFALWEWMRLAEVYPLARASLTRVRLEAAVAALGSSADREAFHEALSIDRVLDDDSAASYDLIGRVEAEHGDGLDDYYNDEVFRVLWARQEYRRCLRWMGDPARELDLAAEMLDFDRASTSPEAIRKRAADRFLDRAIELAVVLLGAGNTSRAEEIVRQARRHLDHPRLNGALEEARQILEKSPPAPG